MFHAVVTRTAYRIKKLLKNNYDYKIFVMSHQLSKDLLPFDEFCSPHAALILSTKVAINSLYAESSTTTCQYQCSLAENSHFDEELCLEMTRILKSKPFLI